LHQLNIEASQSSTIQAPKSTTNASLSSIPLKKGKENPDMGADFSRKANASTKNASNRPKHFDFSKA
jgi:hypothetical protein